jgi:hypothetical protein
MHRRPKTIPPTKRGDKSEPIAPATEAELEALDAVDRPRTRGDCIDAPRPCPFVSCKHHLYLDVNPETGALRLTFPDRGVDEIPESCALDVADQGAATLHQVGVLVNLTRERIRQIEVRASFRLRHRRKDLEDPPPEAISVFERGD